MNEYNKTQLNPDKAFERHVFHRDQFAHYLRWCHLLKNMKIGYNVLDFGCGIKGNAAEVLYRNKYKANNYLGLDIRDLKNAEEKFKNVKWASFEQLDLVKSDMISIGNNWDIIISFEVIEHVGKQNAKTFLENIKKCMNKNTLLLLSTPNFDENVGAVKNHIINGIVGEFKFNELKDLLENYFEIIDVFGTFSSQKDYKNSLNDWQLKTFNKLKKYYDSNLVSNLMAPIIKPEHARNCVWQLKLKKVIK